MDNPSCLKDIFHQSTNVMGKTSATREAATNASPLQSSDYTMNIAGTNPEVDPSQDGRYSWVCVVCVFLINMHTFGINGVGCLLSTGKARLTNV